MANALITPTIIAKEALMQLRNNLVMANKVHRDYKKEFVKVGDTVNVRRPVKFVASDGATRVNQDVEEANTPFVINKRKHVSWKFTTQDLTLTVEEYSRRYITPAAIALANQIDYDLCTLYTDVWNWVGTPGQTINSFADFAKAPERLDEMAVPQDMRCAVMAPADHWGLIGSQTALLNNNLVGSAYTKGSLGNIGGVETSMDQNVRAHVVGVATGTPLVNGGAQNVTYATAKTTNSQSLVTDGWTNSTSGILRAGDVFTIAGVNAVNPVSKADNGFLQQFTVLADADSGTTTGPATLTISPAIITSGPYQTVTAAPADNAAITVLGTGGSSYRQNLVFHKNAFGLVMCPLELPDGAAFKARETHENTSLRVVKDFNIDDDEDIIRIDVLYGIKSLYPDLAARASGTA
ncbi:hypothetical protein HBA54_04195 [Pelagibius litoralis]|uniref:P22 coat protein-gene protein 5 n=1 Tax=Pelagibius litoralis TaxID=374515 RepID=A0A967CAM8_9PROT|nr:P22 phage major capsid protein family protein [Pelagibius litoralis]NIA67783.1 hypothetical protein [Pelagibius litoralis]